MKRHILIFALALAPLISFSQEYKAGVQGLTDVQSYSVAIEHYSIEYSLSYYPAHGEIDHMGALIVNPRWYGDNMGAGPSLALTNKGLEFGLKYALRLRPFELNLGASTDQRTDQALRVFGGVSMFFGYRTTNQCGDNSPF